MTDYFGQIRRVLLTVLVLNWGVAAAKLVVGLTVNSMAITADGYHSLSDGTSNILGLIGVAWASKPVDPEHPYGHQKYETVAAAGIAALLFWVAYSVASEALGEIGVESHLEATPLSFAVMAATMAVNVLTMRFETAAGRRLGSELLLSDASHTRADLLTSASVLMGLVAVRMGYGWADPVVALIVAIFIARAGMHILRENVEILADRAPVSEADIQVICRGVPGVGACHNIRSRGRPDDVHVDLHVLVEPGIAIKDAHDIAEGIEQAIKHHIKGVTDVVVHVEPDTETERRRV